MSRRKVVAFISTLLLAAACHSGTPKFSPEQARQIALQQRFYREWLAAEPPPQAYLQPADRERLRLISKTCSRTDLGHGCHFLFQGDIKESPLGRDAPCAIYRADYVTSRPIDQCYRMTPPKHFKGIWVDQFEGSRFYPGLTQVPPRHDIAFDAANAREHIERKRRQSIWLDVERVALPHGYSHGRRNGRAVMVEFVGRQTLYPGHYGHLGMSAHQIIVDKLISARELG